MPVKTKSIKRIKKQKRGFASMSAEARSEIARLGGIAVSRNRRHMASIGAVGGYNSHHKHAE